MRYTEMMKEVPIKAEEIKLPQPKKEQVNPKPIDKPVDVGSVRG